MDLPSSSSIGSPTDKNAQRMFIDNSKRQPMDLKKVEETLIKLNELFKFEDDPKKKNTLRAKIDTMNKRRDGLLARSVNHWD